MSTAYENLKKLMELAIRQLKEIKEYKKLFEQEAVESLESPITDLITELIDAAKS